MNIFIKEYCCGNSWRLFNIHVIKKPFDGDSRQLFHVLHLANLTFHSPQH
jgi:hypothetical protein